MKFVFVSYNYDPAYDSPDTWFIRIKGYMGALTALAKNNEVVRVKQINYEGEREYNGVLFRFVNYGDAKLRFPRKLHRLIRSMNADVVVVHGLQNPLQVIQLRFQLPQKTKIIVQNHAEEPATGLKKQLQRIADKYVDAYLFASTAMGIDWVKRGNLRSPEKIHEVMEISSVFYPIDREEAIKKTGASGGPVFLFVGRLIQKKDPLNVVNAFLKFAAINPAARLYIFYHIEDLLPQITALINNSPYGKNITLMGKVPNDDMLYWYNSADFIIAGSFHEGSGTAVCEALSCGCVPILTDIFSFRMMTNNGDFGILYEPGNEAELLEALKQTQHMNVPEQRAKAIAWYQSNLSFEAIAKQMEDIAAALLGK
ncbi:MAG TPA: glycosyltransferase family 4 protein [Mucilaginibacter sp.]|jgi:glycosyltransferase involved in cell wall biosynthesis|nr:glycosyltransferase family 4 protein [Mucilaginibacter sp.]